MVNKMSCPECLGRDYGNFADVMVERQRQLATQDLGGIAEVLHALLKEGPAS